MFSLLLGGIIMRDMINERLRDLATASDCMMDLFALMDSLEERQLDVERNAYDSINISDKALILSKEGKKLIFKLRSMMLSSCSEGTDSCQEDCLEVLEEVSQIFSKIMESVYSINETSHCIEHEVAHQQDVTVHLKKQLSQVNDRVKQVTACAELLLVLDN